MATQAEIAMLNEALLEQLSTPGMEKQAVDAVNDFTRTTMREDGIYRRIMPPLQIDNSDLHPQVDTDKPARVVEKEPGSPASVTIPFGTLPTTTYIRGPRYRVTFTRIVTPRFVKDVDELRTWHMDIRQVLSDNAIKDMLAEEDRNFLAAVNRAMLGADIPVPYNGNVVQWETISGGITRETLQDARKVMPRGPSHLEARVALVNNVTIKEIEKFDHDEMGGSFSEDVLKNGWSEVEFANMRWVITLKRDLVPDDTIFMFADPKFIGKNFMLEDATMYVRREAYMLEFFQYETIGGSIGHTGGLARVDFA